MGDLEPDAGSWYLNHELTSHISVQSRSNMGDLEPDAGSWCLNHELIRHISAEHTDPDLVMPAHA